MGSQSRGTPYSEASHANVRRFTDLDGLPSVTCVPEGGTVDLGDVPDPCELSSCNGGTCVNTGGFPACACDAGTAGILSGVVPDCRPILEISQSPGGDNPSLALDTLEVCAPAPPVCDGEGQWLEPRGAEGRHGVTCQSSIPDEEDLIVPEPPSCPEEDSGCEVSARNRDGSALTGLLFFAAGPDAAASIERPGRVDGWRASRGRLACYASAVRRPPLFFALLAFACSGQDPGGDGAAETSSTDTSSGSETSTEDGSESDESTDEGGPPGGSPGCGNDEAQTGVFATNVTILGEDREITIVVPPSYDPDTPYPLVFAWHGLGSNPTEARLYFGVEQAAGDSAIFVYPLGLPVATMGNQAGWDLNPNGEDVVLFDALVGGMSDEYCIAEDYIFSTGHSFGGYMTNTVGCARGDVLRGIAPVAGGGPFGNCGTTELAAWLSHGESDSTVPFSEGESSRDHWLDINGCSDQSAPVDPDPCTHHEGCADGHPVHWCPHQEQGLGGHQWPSFAGTAIWDFFSSL